MRLKRFSLILFCLLLTTSLQAAERVALVIGNQQYKDAPLRNPVADARSISQSLTRMGFAVRTVYNANTNTLNTALDQFEIQAKQAQIALIFYAGHGIQLGGKNYLIPTNVALKSRRDLRKLINLDDLVSEVGQAKQFGVVILDACRNNPFGRSLGVNLSREIKLGRGLARIDNPINNVFVATATKAGATAADGVGQTHSPYTFGLLANLEKAKDIRLLFGDVRDNVRKRTRNQQSPDTYSALGGATYCLTKRCGHQGNGSVTPPVVSTPRKPNPAVKKPVPSVSHYHGEQQHHQHALPNNQIAHQHGGNKAGSYQIVKKPQPPKRPAQGGRRIGQYIDHGNGTVTDTKTKLMWKKCSEGQSGNNCAGKAKKYRWKQAVQQFKRVSFAGYNDWRVPAIKELRTLVYCSNGIPQKEAWKEGCSGENNRGGIHNYQDPTINLDVFPNVDKYQVYWSSSSSPVNSNNAWMVHFSYGYNSPYNYNFSKIRLVRNGQ